MDDNDYNPSYLSCHDSGSLNEERQNNDDIKAWDSANEYLFSALRLTITGAARSVLLKFEQTNGRPGDGRYAWLALKNKYQNTSRKCKRTLLILRRLDNSVMRSDVDLDVFLSDVLQLRDELNDLGNVVSNERLATIILDELPKDVYSTIKLQLTTSELSASTPISGRL